jgi:hypothetical protein
MNDRPEWTAQARRVLEDSAQALDAATLSRLNQARQRALAAAMPPQRGGLWARRLAVAASLLLAAALWWPDFSADPGNLGASTLSPEDAELLADDELEMTDELEFYAWLDADDEHNG